MEKNRKDASEISDCFFAVKTGAPSEGYLWRRHAYSNLKILDFTSSHELGWVDAFCDLCLDIIDQQRNTCLAFLYEVRHINL